MKNKKYKMWDIEVEGVITPTSIDLLPTKTNKPVNSIWKEFIKNMYVSKYPRALVNLSQIEYKVSVPTGKYKLEVINCISKFISCSDKTSTTNMLYVNQKLKYIADTIYETKNILINEYPEYYRSKNPITYISISYSSSGSLLLEKLKKYQASKRYLKQIKKKINNILKQFNDI